MVQIEIVSKRKLDFFFLLHSKWRIQNQPVVDVEVFEVDLVAEAVEGAAVGAEDAAEEGEKPMIKR